MKTRITRIASALLLTTYCLLPTFSFAQPGSLDLSFGTGGIVTTPIGPWNEAYSVAIQTDGKLVVAGVSMITGDWDFALVRYTTNGALDNTFGTGGKVTTPIGSDHDEAYSVAIQTDGKLVVAGSSYNGDNYDFALVRYTTNGSLDLTFGTGGIVTTDLGGNGDLGYSVAIQTDGKLVVAGSGGNANNNNGNSALVRYTTNGALDPYFGTGGIVTTTFGTTGNSVAIQTDGKLVVAGVTIGNFALARYTSNGSLDLTFGTGGRVATNIGSSDDVGQSVAIQTDGKLVVAGYGGSQDFAVVRYNGEGVTSIAENTMKADFTVYPNPNTGIFTIELDATLQLANYTLRIMNTLGQEVYQSAIATPQATIDISTLSKGIYLLSLSDGEQEAHRKIIKE
jgi:uncharacterized delta-60 repeat protein